MNFSKIKELKPYDLNCNIFDVYSYDGLSMQELLCQFFTKINECIKTSNETIDLAEWLVNEGLKQEVALKLTKWLNDGTLENLINVTLFENLNKKIDNVSSQLEQIAYVNHFGADSTGVTDSTNTIQNVINLGYKVIRIVGNYLVNGTLEPQEGQTIEIEGEIRTENSNNTIILIKNNNVKITGNGILKGKGNTIGNTSGVITNSSNSVIEGIRVTDFSNCGIGSGIGASRFKVRNTTSYLNRTGISAYRTTNINISNNEVYLNGIGHDGGGIVITELNDSLTKDFVISNNNVYNNTSSGICCYNVNRGSISGNICNDNGGGSVGQGSGIVLLLGSSGSSLSDISVTGNSCCKNSDHGIVVQNNKDNTSFITGITIASNNCFSNYKTGIRLVNGVDLCVITGNTCNSNGTSTSSPEYRHGIMITDRCTRNIISSNTCLSNKEDGICITDLSVDFSNSGCGENTIIGNNCRNNVRNGVSILTNTINSSNNRILYNYLRGNGNNLHNQGVNNDSCGNKFSVGNLDGTANLLKGVATIKSSEVLEGDKIYLSVISASGEQGALFISSVNDGEFTVKSTSSSDNSTFKWRIEH